MKTAIIIHGYNVNAYECFYQWLKIELEKIGYNVELPNLPNTSNPNDEEQVDYILKKYPNKKDIIIGHSFGACVAMKLLQRLDYKIDSLFLVSGFIDTNFPDGDTETLSTASNWKFNFGDIKSKSKVFVLRPVLDTEIDLDQTKSLANKLNVPINYFKQAEDHACGKKEPGILKFIKNNG
jgi:uncharacterized protein